MQTTERKDARGNIIPARSSHAYSPPVQRDTEDSPSFKWRGLLVRYWPHVVAGMALMFGFYLLMTRLVIPFVVSTQQRWDYGYSRVSVYDLNVGHNGVSHFVAQYYKNQIVIVEILVDHPGENHIYSMYESVGGDNSEHVITLTTAYVNHHAVAGKPDLVVSVSGFAIPVVLYNTGDSFRTGE